MNTHFFFFFGWMMWRRSGKPTSQGTAKALLWYRCYDMVNKLLRAYFAIRAH